jgi:hypothetical protein
MRPNDLDLRASRQAKIRGTHRHIATGQQGIQSWNPTKEVLHSGLSEKVFRFYAYT